VLPLTNGHGHNIAQRTVFVQRASARGLCRSMAKMFEEINKQGHVERRRGNDEAQVITDAEELAKEPEQKIRVRVAFVRFVNHDYGAIEQ
jgi:hypothetical protein